MIRGPGSHQLECVLAVRWCHQRSLCSPGARDRDGGESPADCAPSDLRKVTVLADIISMPSHLRYQYNTFYLTIYCDCFLPPLPGSFHGSSGCRCLSARETPGAFFLRLAAPRPPQRSPPPVPPVVCRSPPPSAWRVSCVRPFVRLPRCPPWRRWPSACSEMRSVRHRRQRHGDAPCQRREGGASLTLSRLCLVCVSVFDSMLHLVPASYIAPPEQDTNNKVSTNRRQPPARTESASDRAASYDPECTARMLSRARRCSSPSLLASLALPVHAQQVGVDQRSAVDEGEQ